MKLSIKLLVFVQIFGVSILNHNLLISNVHQLYY